MAIKAKSTRTRRMLSTDNDGQKRFSKNRIKRELQEQTYVENQEKVISVKPKEKRQYKSDFVERYEFRGTPKKIFSALLKKRSSTQRGYSTLNAGQQVIVEDFGGDQPLRVTSMDGRQGITSYDNIKSLFPCVENK